MFNSAIEIDYFASTILKHGKYKYFWEYQLVDKIFRHVLFRENDGEYVMEEDWDYLIILDGCRYDVFAEEINYRKKFKKLKCKLESKISRGTDTTTFLIENFREKYYPNIIYITANPFVNIFLKNKFYKIIPVWNKGWNSKYNTVLPSAVYKYSLKILSKYPNKKLIIHFMQPHHPFITLREIKDEGFESHIISSKTGKKVVQGYTVYHYLARGIVSKERVLRAYKENLKIVMDYVERLINFMGGKIVITSDHGDSFGEKIHPLLPLRVYGHPRGVRIDSLIRVPWFIVEKSKSKKHSVLEKKIIKKLVLKKNF